MTDYRTLGGLDLDGFDLDGIGLTLDDLDLEGLPSPPPSPLDRPKWKPLEHWQTSDQESHFHDVPNFDSLHDRARYFVNEMGRATLANIPNSTADDPLFEYRGEMVSLNDLLAPFDHDAVNDILKHL